MEIVSRKNNTILYCVLFIWIEIVFELYLSLKIDLLNKKLSVNALVTLLKNWNTI